MKTKKTFNIALTGIMGAVALALSFLESLIPQIPLLPPGAKLGLANIAVMFTVLSVGNIQGICVAVIKSVFVLLTNGASAFFMSISGGLLSVFVLIVMITVDKKSKFDFSYIFLSVVCAVCHNTGQVCAASIYTSTNLVKSYLPVLVLFGVGAGIITGIVLNTVMPALNKIAGSRRYVKR